MSLQRRCLPDSLRLESIPTEIKILITGRKKQIPALAAMISVLKINKDLTIQ